MKICKIYLKDKNVVIKYKDVIKVQQTRETLEVIYYKDGDVKTIQFYINSIKHYKVDTWFTM